MNAPTSSDGQESPRRIVLDLIADLRAGTLSSASLSVEERRACVAYLHPEGVTIPEMARLLGRNERTIARDLAELRSRNALRIDANFVAEQVGALMQEAATSISRIRRTVRDRETSAAVRVDGERAVFDIADRLTARLQSLGYLPTVGTRVQADVTCHLGESVSLASVVAELEHLSQIAGSSVGVPGELTGELDRATQAVRTLTLLPAPAEEVSDERGAE